MKKIIGRLNDWRRERGILGLASQALRIYANGSPSVARLVDLMRIAEINDRSAEQIERMERRMGLR